MITLRIVLLSVRQASGVEFPQDASYALFFYRLDTRPLLREPVLSSHIVPNVKEFPRYLIAILSPVLQ